MRTLMITIAALAIAAAAPSAAAQDQAAPDTQASSAARAFQHYEGVRAALSSDKFADVAPHAKELPSAVEPVGGAEARKAADALAAAGTIEDARKHFGELSVILVPKFQAAQIKGARAFTCGMKNLPWMQRGDKVENPYYGKSMLTCGSPLPPKAK